MTGRASTSGDVGTVATVTRRQLLRLGGVVVLAPTLAGCGADFFRKATEDREMVEMVPGQRFQPATVTIPVGATVVWSNESTVPHTATCDPGDERSVPQVQLPEGAAAWDSGYVYPGGSWERTFDVAGTYVYACRFHGDVGMIGTITVIE